MQGIGFLIRSTRRLFGLAANAVDNGGLACHAYPKGLFVFRGNHHEKNTVTNKAGYKTWGKKNNLEKTTAKNMFCL